MPISLEKIAIEFGSRVNPWRAAVEMPKVPAYSILIDVENDCLYIASGSRCTLFVSRRDIDDHYSPDAEWFRVRAQKIMQDWEDLPVQLHGRIAAAS